MGLSAGTRLGPYEILAPLGAGGMGEVYRARDPRLKRDVAVKVLPEGVANDPGALARFEREALAVAALSHPNVLVLFDVGHSGGIAYAVMELLEGATLRQKLLRGPIPAREAVDYALQVIRGLAAAHGKGIVHRDLKPENLFVTLEGHVKILDFGLARQDPLPGTEGTDGSTLSVQTRPGAVLGTLGYMSPEQARGLPADHRSDVFSFGAVVYELLSGKKAFGRDSAADTVAAILKEEPPDLSAAGPDVPPGLARIVRRCLEKDPERRFQSARDVGFALEELSAGALPGAASGTATNTTGRRKAVFLVAASAAALLLLVAGGNFLLRRKPAAVQGPKTIAVLPFANLSADREQEFFSDGLTEELMGLLSRARGLRVTGRTSSFVFKGKTDDLRTIGKRLDVASVLEGSVQRSGDRVRVSVRLVDTADGYQVWSETYDRTMTEIFAVQDEIAGAVVAALKVRLLPGESVETRRKSANQEAYLLYLGAKERRSGETSGERFRRGHEALRKAVALDPGFAAAWAGLAGSETFLADSSETAEEREAGRLRAVAAAEKAISLDPELADGWQARGFIRYGTDWDWAGAQADFDKAHALDPGMAGNYVMRAKLLATHGRLDEAVALARRGTEVEPLSDGAWTFLGDFLSASNRYSEARQALGRALEIDPGNGQSPFFHFELGYAWLLEGNAGEALKEFSRAKGAWGAMGIAMAEHSLGHAHESRQALEELVAKHAGEAAYQIACVYAWRNEKNEAFRWLDRAYEQRDGGLADIGFDAPARNLRDDPRYAALMQKLKLPANP